MKSLILGGARSGKSRYAQRLAEQRSQDGSCSVYYIATATAGDDEMAHRIAKHQQERPDHWQLIEEPLDLVGVLAETAAGNRVLLVDCLTLWLSNHLCMPEGESQWAEASQRLHELVPSLPGDQIFVANEVGMGLVPDNALGRQFRDEAGRLNQQLASLCDNVVFVAAGLPLVLKNEDHH